MEPINTNQDWDSPDAPSMGVERNLRLQNVAVQIQLMHSKSSRNLRKDKKKQQEDFTTDTDAD